MAGRPHPHNFLNYQLGYVQEFSVRATAKESPLWMSRLIDEGRPHREWVMLEDGPKIEATYKGRKLELIFGRRSDVQRVRRWLTDASRPLLAKLELTATADGMLEGSLCLSQTALTGELHQAPEILLTEAVIDQVGNGKFENAEDKLTRGGGVESPWSNEQFVLVTQTSVQFRQDAADEDSDVRIVLSNGHNLVCRLQEVDGGQYLKAVGYKKRDGEEANKISDVQFVNTPKMPRFVQSEDDLEGTSLGDFQPLRNDHLTAWVEYELAEKKRRKALLERRQEVHLEYSEVVDEPRRDPDKEEMTRWKVRLANHVDECEKWLDDDQKIEMSAVKLEAPAALHSLTAKGGADSDSDTNGANVVKLKRDSGSDSIIATITWKSNQSPPTQGKLVATEHYGDKAQEDRRDNALERLRSGQSANPGLLRYLLFPRAIPQIESKDVQMWYRPGAPSLNKAQKKAVIRAAREPDIFLIQGPPGTGKTTVIAEIIHQLRHRYRSRTGGEPGSGAGPLRVLVSSIQNDAVANAADRLGAEDVYVDRHVRGEENNRAAELKGKKIVEELTNRMEKRDAFQRYRALCELREEVEKLAPYLGGEPEKVLTYIDEFLGAEPLKLLGANLKDDLLRLRTGLESVMEQEARATAGDDDKEPGLPQDFLAHLHRFSETPDLVEKNDYAKAMKLVEELETLLEDGPEQVRQQGRRLATLASSCRRGLRRATKTGELRSRTQKKWVELLGEAESLVHDDDDDNREGDAEPRPRNRWQRSARDWLGRVRQDLEERFAEFHTREEAVLFEWVSRLDARPDMMSDVVTEYSPVRAATCQKSPQFYDDSKPYDVVVIDEAARGGLDVLIPMTMGRSIILIGDQNQLPPHVEQELERQLGEEIRRKVDLTETSLFSYLWEQLGGPMTSTNCVSLTTQYRMHREIGEVVSRAFYEPEGLKLDHHCPGGADAERAPAFGLFGDEPFVWVDTSDVLQNRSLRSSHRGSWPCHTENHYEASLIVSILEGLGTRALEELRRRESGKSIGVIPFYKDQLYVLDRLIDRRVPHLRQDIESGTADSFQGKDFPLVLLSTVRSNKDGKVGFLELPNRINVGISRAKNQVVLVGDSDTLTHKEAGSQPFKRVWEVVDEASGPGTVISSREVT